MAEYIKSQGWKVVGKTESGYFTGRNAVVNFTLVLEVTPEKVLVNGCLFHSYIIPSVEEARFFANN